MLKVSKVTALIILGVVAILSLMAFSHRSGAVALRNGGYVHIRPPSIWASIRGARCRIVYRSNREESGTIDLWQNLVHWPVAVMAATNDNALLCLYEFDTDLRLLRINLARKFKPFPTANSSCLSSIVCSSPWEVEEAKIGDWQQSLARLKDTSAGSPSRQMTGPWPVAFGYNSKATLRRMEQQIKLMLDNGASQWPVTTTVR